MCPAVVPHWTSDRTAPGEESPGPDNRRDGGRARRAVGQPELDPAWLLEHNVEGCLRGGAVAEHGHLGWTQTRPRWSVYAQGALSANREGRGPRARFVSVERA